MTVLANEQGDRDAEFEITARLAEVMMRTECLETHQFEARGQEHRRQ